MWKSVIIRNIAQIEKESAHDWSGARKLLLSQEDNISENIEAMTKWYLQPGKTFDWHSHEGIDEYFFVTQWKGTITFEDWREVDYSVDSFIYIPAELKHKIEAKWDVENIFYFTRIYNK